jgi:hypothetical protein
MKKIIAKIDFVLNGEDYIAGDEIKTDDIKIIRKLNEKGFIEPLEYRDLVLIERELNKKKNEL